MTASVTSSMNSNSNGDSDAMSTTTAEETAAMMPTDDFSYHQGIQVQAQAPMSRKRQLRFSPLGTTTATTSTGDTTTTTTTATTTTTSSVAKQTTFVIIDHKDEDEEKTDIRTSSPTSETTTASLASTNASSSNTKRNIVNLVLTEATLLSGNLDDCYSANDESCKAGVAAVGAFARHLALRVAPTLVFPKFEKQSQFVQVHPLGWSVNRLILQGLMGWKMLMSTPSLLLQNGRDGYGTQRDLSYLQSSDFPLLLTNVAVPPSNSWAWEYHEYVHFDHATGLALLSIANSGEPLNHDQVASAWGALHTIADRNRALNCLDEMDSDRQALFASYQQVYMNGDGTSAAASSAQDDNHQKPPCWIPVVSFDDSQAGKFETFIREIMQHPYPPYLIIDVDKNAPDLYPVPMLVEVPITGNNTLGTLKGNATTVAATTNGEIRRQPTQQQQSQPATRSVWIHSFGRKDDIYYQHQLELDWNTTPPTLTNVTLIQEDMGVVPEEYKDDLYAHHIAFLRQQADSAIQNDPQVGYSTEFPVAREGEYRQCQGGECQVGNLFTDALRWKAHADVAFVTSGGLRGSGWPAGPVRASHIWSSLPFPNSICTGIMSGRSLFQMLEYSIGIATFEGYDTNDGDRLVQVSGMNIVYNTEIPRGSSRILSIEIWNHDVKEWLPIERLGMYKFATDSYLCNAYDPYPDFLGANGNYTLEGEVPGSTGDILVQNAVGEYLGQLGGPYDAAIQGRLVNNTNSFVVLDMSQTKENCPANNYWTERRSACFPCPDSTHVEFSDARLEFEGQSGHDGGIIPSEESKASSIYNSTSLLSPGDNNNNTVTDTTIFDDVLAGRVLLVNREVSNFSVVPKAIPSWLKFVEGGELSERFVVGGPATVLPSGSSLALDFIVGDESLRSGTALGTVSFGILGRSSVQGEEGIRSCDDYSRDATFDVFLKITPPQELNELGGLRFIGIGIMIITLLTAIFFGYCLFKYRQTAILKTMQPIFLVTVCCGVFTLALTILPLSLDDMILSEAGADAACMAVPWLLSNGLVVIFSALYSKLLRINKLFSVASFRRLKVTEWDVLAPFAVLFTLNTALMTAWNVIDPLRSQRLIVEGEDWKSYAACRSIDGVGYALMYSIGAVNLAALLMACYQAWQARNISGEFAESRSVGLAVGCWVQVLLVGFPALYLVDPDDIVASYFLQVGLLFVLCMSMMLIIFGPLVMMVFRYKSNPGAIDQARQRGSVFVTGATSLHDGASFHSGYNGSSGRTGTSMRRSQSLIGSRKTSTHSFAGQDDKSLREMVSIAKELRASANNSASSLGDSFNNTSKAFEAPPEDFHDEETGNIGMGKDFSRRPVSAIMEESESAFSVAFQAVPSTQQAVASTPELDELAESIASIKCPEEEVTPQMLLLDLVPKSTAERMMDESESTVPFCGGDFMSDNLLGDSDSSIPFQGSNADLDDSLSSSANQPSMQRTQKQQRTPEMKIPVLAKDETPSTETSATDLSRSASNYSQHLLQSSSCANSDTPGGHQRIAVLYRNNMDSSLNEQDVFRTKDGPADPVEPLVIATIEYRTAKKAAEIPFSSRFLEYKNRLSSQRSEDGTFSTIDSPTIEGSRPDKTAKMNGSTTKMNDHSNRSGSDRRGNFQMMNDYIVQSMRDVSDHNASRRMDDSSTGSFTKEESMKDRSFRSGSTSRKMADRSDRGTKDNGGGGFISRLMSDRSGGRTGASRSKGDPSIHDQSSRQHTLGDRTRRQSVEVNSDDLYPWQENGDASSARAWEDIARGRSSEKKGVLKSTLSALHQSMSNFHFSPGADSPGHKKPLAKMKNPFAALNLSVPALHYTHGARDDDDDDDDKEGQSHDFDLQHIEPSAAPEERRDETGLEVTVTSIATGNELV